MFREWLAERMAEKDWNMPRLGEALGVTAVTVSKWLKGKTMPERHRVPALARIFGVTEAEVRQFYPCLEPAPPPEDWRDQRLREVIDLDDAFAATLTMDDVNLFLKLFRATGRNQLAVIRNERTASEKPMWAIQHHSVPGEDQPVPTTQSGGSSIRAMVPPEDREQESHRELRDGAG